MSVPSRAVKEIIIEKVDGDVVCWDGGTCWVPPKEYFEQIAKVGSHFLMETIRYSQVVGMSEIFEDETTRLIYSQTDEEIEAEHAARMAEWDAKAEASWVKQREGLLARVAVLPEPLLTRMETFHANGGHAFEKSGLAYELSICEMAALWLDGGEEKVEAYAKEHDATGNTFDCAKALAKVIIEHPDHVQDFPAGLAPITGDVDYSKAGAQGG